MVKIYKIILPFLLFTLLTNSIFATVSHEEKGVDKITHSARKLGVKTKEGMVKLGKILQFKKSTNGLSNAAKHELYKKQLRQSMSKPKVQDPKLKKFMNNNYRDNAKTGSGSTADALRQEKITGKPVGGKWHEQKARNQVDGLRKWIDKNPNASSTDSGAAEQLMLDLMNALGDI